MKITIILLAISCLQVNAKSYAQRVSLHVKNSSINDVLYQLTKQTGYNFVADASLLSQSKRITLEAEQEQLEKVLEACFTDKPIEVIFSQNGTIVIREKRASNSPAAQQRLISGSVTDAGGKPLPGVTVSLAQSVTTTNEDGRYQLSVNTLQGRIRFTILGYRTEEREIPANNVLNVTLQEMVSDLDEVVILGYGSQRKGEVTGAISSIKGEEIAKMTVGSMGSALQGKVSGVSVVGAGSEPGKSPQIFVRGISTFGNNAPLYVVDGVPLDNIDFLNPKDIASLDVLKDASAAAIYGSRASNGVIMVTTTSGIAGKTSVTFEANTGFSDALRKPKMAGAAEYVMLMNLAAENSGRQPVYPDPSAYTETTDWWNEITQTGMTQNYSVGLSSGTDKLRVNSSLGYYKESGLVKTTDFNRITFRLRTEYNLSKRLKIGEDLNLSRTGRTPTPDPGGSHSIFQNAINGDPITPARMPDRSSNPYDNYGGSPTDIPNSLAVIERNFQRQKETFIVGSIFGNYEILDGLTFETRFSLSGNLHEFDSFSPTYNIDAGEMNLVNSVLRTNDQFKYWNSTNTLTYKKTIGQHNFTILAGLTREKFIETRLMAAGQNIPSNDPTLQTPVASTDGFNIGVGQADRFDNVRTLASYLGRLTYDYAGKYLLSASIRADGSSIFAKQNRWGYFPAVSAGWVLSEENFLKGSDLISNLKLRAGYGQVGNQKVVPLGQYLSTLGTVYSAMGQSQASQLGVTLTSVPNADLKWETVEDINLGADVGILENKLSLSGDYFVRNVKDMIASRLIVAYAGYGENSPYSNVGQMRTTGFEFNINYSNNEGPFTYSIGANGTHYRAIATRLESGNDIFAGNNPIFERGNLTREGHPVGAFFGYHNLGVFQNQEQIDNYRNQAGTIIQPNARPGDFMFADLNGDGVINSNDRTFIGDPTPWLTFGLNLTGGYKGFDLTVFFAGTLGGDLANAMKGYTYSGSYNYNKVAGLADMAWHGEGTSNTVPRVVANDNNGNFTKFNDFYIESATFVRLRNVQLGYTLPNTLTQRMHLQKLRLFASVQNLLTFTGYSGLDPEIGYGLQWTDGNSYLNKGLDLGNYPTARTFLFGINLTL